MYSARSVATTRGGGSLCGGMPSACAICRSDAWMIRTLAGPARSSCFCAAVSPSSRGSAYAYPIPFGSGSHGCHGQHGYPSEATDFTKNTDNKYRLDPCTPCDPDVGRACPQQLLLCGRSFEPRIGRTRTRSLSVREATDVTDNTDTRGKPRMSRKTRITNTD